MSESEGIVLKDQRILVPIVMRSTILEKLHQGHPGIEKTKQRASQTVFWPRINEDIENLVSKCSFCQELGNANSKEALNPYPIPVYPWQLANLSEQISFTAFQLSFGSRLLQQILGSS